MADCGQGMSHEDLAGWGGVGPDSAIEVFQITAIQNS
jgi:hypothetical protein